MNDQTTFRPLRNALLAGAASVLALAVPAQAGDKVLYSDVPQWVEEAPIDTSSTKGGPSLLVFDWQHRLENGVVTTYGDLASRIDNPQALMENGTISRAWLPDKGDLTIHRVQILRGGEVIDVMAGGATFDVIRREQGLEQRLLDGELTATLAVPGLQVGDILRITHSVTVDDQALGDEMQVLQWLGTKPWQVGFGRTIVSWPENEEVFWRAEDHAALREPVTRDGMHRIEVTLPLAQMPEMPGDAPARYHRNPVLRVGTYADWQELSRTMAPHFAKAAKIAGDSPVAEQARAIMAKTSDPLHRAALATQLVQDEVSYLLNGLEGGNYLPQSADETWEKRYGDCKAKSVLLHALLTEMGIVSQTVLVQTRGGDAVPELLPLPGNFDHMIVRAQIGGEDYWLDGTSAATRIGNIGWVPPFHHALPLTEEGAGLVAMAPREQATPNMEMAIVSDYSAGVDLPALFTMEMKFYGPQSAGFQRLLDEGDMEQLRQIAKSFGSNQGTGAVSSVAIDYDPEQAMGVMRISGITTSDFEWKEGRLVIDSDLAPDAAFNASRAKPEWRDIPVFTAGPMRNRIRGELILPKEAEGFTFEGEERVEATYANTRISADSALRGNRFSGKVDIIQSLGEIAPEQLPEVKRAVQRLANQESRLVAPSTIVWRWQLDRKALDKRAQPILAAYNEAIDFADPDDYAPLQQRATFLGDIFRFEDALADLDTLVAKDTSAWALLWRAGLYRALGRTDDAIADMNRSYELEPTTATAMAMAELMAYNGQAPDAIELLEGLPVSDEDSALFAGTLATVVGLSGDLDRGLQIMAEAVAQKPQNPTALNSDCWYRGLFNTGLDGALEICTRAIERADNSAPMLDSRAMVYYRLGEFDEAIADLDSALELSPGLAASHYLRGVVKLDKGDQSGRKDIDIALRIEPELKARYARHGVVAK